MKLVATALFRAVLTQLHPRMLWLALWPFLLALLFWGAVGFWFRDEALSALHDVIFGLELTRWVEALFRFFGLEGLVLFLVPILYGFLLLALTIVTALLVIGIAMMPTVVGHVASRQYPGLVRLHGGSFFVSASNAVFSTVLFLLGWIITMPLWLILPLAVLLPWFWWAWLSMRILRYDSLAQHASAEERRILYHKHRIGYFAIGLATSALNFVPPLFFLAPIFSGIGFTHYSLLCLGELRGGAFGAEPAHSSGPAVPPTDASRGVPPNPPQAEPGPVPPVA
ncbi:MAG: EI24 domain-containing protein [Burkholderiaceae bacterium]|jgi:hypothetical protein